jgi:hypothetical protein
MRAASRPPERPAGAPGLDDARATVASTPNPLPCADVTIPLARRLISAGTIDRAELHRALVEHVSRKVAFPRALLDAGVLSERDLDEQLGRSEIASVKAVVPVGSLLDKLPEGLCARLLAVPIRIEASTGKVDVATVDPFDAHVEAEMSFHLETPVRLVRAPLAVLEAALRRALVMPEDERVGGLSPRSVVPGRGVGVDGKSMVPLAPGPTVPRPPSVPDIDLLEDADLLGEDGPTPGFDDDDDDEPVLLLSQLKSNPAGLPTPLPQSPRALDVSTVAAMLRRAATRDEVVDALMGGLRAVARRVGVFAVRKREVQGFRCNEELAEPRELREVVVALEGPSVFATALATGCYVGPVPLTAAHAPLIQAVRGFSAEVAVLPISVSGKAALLVLLDEVGDILIATRRAEDLGRLAGEAFARLLAEGKK